MSLVLTDQSGNPLGALTFNVERGVPATAVPIMITNNGATEVDGAFMTMYVEDPPSSGNYESSGQPPTDERFGRLEITGVVSTTTPGQSYIPGVVQPMGHLQNAPLPAILAGDALLANLWLDQGGSSAAGGSFNVKFELAGDTPARPVPEGLTLVGRGIDSGVNQSRTTLISGRALSATPGDDKVHSAAGSWLYKGTLVTDASIEDSTLNQNDGASAALTSGNSYIALISQGLSTTPNITKGVQGASPVAPNLPAGDILLGVVNVSYQAGGTSVINSGDVTQNTPVYWRYLVADGGGLNATVYPGEALIDNFHQFNALTLAIALTASTTNYLWLNSDGSVTATLTNVQPAAGSIALATIVTGTSTITSITDTRIFISVAGTLTPHAATHATAGSDPVSPASIGAAPLASPALTGNPTAPTQTALDNSTKLATTAYVDSAVAAAVLSGLPTPQAPVFETGDGTTAAWTLSPVPATGYYPRVYKNGLKQREGIGLDYVRSGGSLETITFGTAPEAGANVEFDYEA